MSDERKEAIEKQRSEAAKKYEENTKRKQDLCKHLKGGKGAKLPEEANDTVLGGSNGIDYNIYQFTFINGSTYIKCHNCRKIWRPDEPGWSDAVAMMKMTTNTASASEQPILPIPIMSRREEKSTVLKGPLAVIKEHGKQFGWTSRDFVISGLSDTIKKIRLNKTFTFEEMADILKKAASEKTNK